MVERKFDILSVVIWGAHKNKNGETVLNKECIINGYGSEENDDSYLVTITPSSYNIRQVVPTKFLSEYPITKRVLFEKEFKFKPYSSKKYSPYDYEEDFYLPQR